MGEGLVIENPQISFSNLLIIHEAKTKEITSMIKHLHKLANLVHICLRSCIKHSCECLVYYFKPLKPLSPSSINSSVKSPTQINYQSPTESPIHALLCNWGQGRGGKGSKHSTLPLPPPLPPNPSIEEL